MRVSINMVCWNRDPGLIVRVIFAVSEYVVHVVPKNTRTLPLLPRFDHTSLTYFISDYT